MPCEQLTRRRLMSQAATWLAIAAGPPAVAAGTAPAAADAAESLRVMRASPLGEPPSGFGYDGVVPGPTLRVRRGSNMRLRLVNGLGEPTALIWHGLRRANALAAAPQRPIIAPGEASEFGFACVDAGTFWYHAADAAQLRRGLYGLVVVEEREPVDADRDLALIIAAPAGAGPVSAAPSAQALPRLVANGGPVVEFSARPYERLRLRLVNAAAMVVAVRLDGLRPVVMALDGQPCEPFVAREAQVFLGPGNRADLFVDITLPAGAAQAIVAATDGGDTVIASLRCDGAPARAAVLAEPAPLPANPLPARMDFAGALKLELDLAGASAGPRPAFTVRRGRTVMLALANRSDAIRTVRLDGHAFRLLDRLDDGWKPFWLDTLVVPPGRAHRIAFVAEAAGAFLIEAAGHDGQAGLSTWFEVT
jgi:FtsP/CotA-like multicopper oxidase with cupredoxin domain